MDGLYKNDGERYFAASNTKDGFVSYFDKVFSQNDCNRVFILKGGPGVGKSTFMKKAGVIAEEKGYTAEYFYCSSDPQSLDGIIIKEIKTAVIDGTNPHAAEPSLAGARETIVDLGRAWDSGLLFSKREELLCLSKSKKKHYSDCYNFLYCKGVMDSLIYNLVFPYILFDKLNKRVYGLTGSLFKGVGKTHGITRTRLTSALSSHGKIRLFTFEDMADFCIFIKEPFYGCRLASVFMRRIFEYAKSIGTDIYVSFSPDNRDDINALYFPAVKTSITLFDENAVANCDRIQKKCRIINCRSFIDTKGFSHLKPLRKFYSKLSQSMENQALESLEKAGKIHAETEKIYRPCTSYKTVEKITNEYLKAIF